MHNIKKTFLLLNNVISILDLFKILTYYIEDKKILEIRNLKYLLLLIVRVYLRLVFSYRFVSLRQNLTLR